MTIKGVTRLESKPADHPCVNGSLNDGDETIYRPEEYDYSLFPRPEQVELSG